MPVEVGERLIEAVPVVADKVPPAAERMRREIVLARFLGKLAVEQGIRELRTRLAPDADVVVDNVVVEAVGAETADTTNECNDVEATTGSSPDAVGSGARAPTADDLALADYDHLSSAQVVSKLAGLDGAELDAIEAYERAGRHRRTILGKLAQVRAAEAPS